MKLFKASNMEIVNCCQRLFGCDLPSTLLKQRFEKKLLGYVFVTLGLCIFAALS